MLDSPVKCDDALGVPHTAGGGAVGVVLGSLDSGKRRVSAPRHNPLRAGGESYQKEIYICLQGEHIFCWANMLSF